MTGRLLFAHAVLWRSDAWYRRAWYVAPQLAAVVAAGWLLTSGGPGPINKPANVAENWGAPLSQKELSGAADALRDRAKTDPRAFESLKRLADLGDPLMQFGVGTLYDSTLNFSKLAAPDMKEALKYYRAAAEQGHLFAAFNYGNALVQGRGVPRDVAAGFPWLLKAANANITQAARLVGILYRDGNGVPPDKAMSLKWFRQAADKGDTYSAAEIGAAYWDGAPPYSKDPAEAVQWFLKAAADPKVVNPAINLGVNLGIAYRDGTGVQQDKAQSLKWFREAAEGGNTYAAAEIGAAYWDGAPPYAKDPTAAVEWFLKAAADPAEVYAARMLGVAYRDGTGAPPEKAVSLKWFRQAADRGDTYAAAEIGAAYWDGAPPYAKDPAAAVQWYLKAAADPAEVNAARMLGFAYRDGIGVQPDKTTSLKWFRQAADQGDTAGAAEIGAAYWDGTPPYVKDVAQAVQWYAKAAADPAELNAARTLGVAYRDGVGVQPDRAVSLKWFRQAADRGDAYAAAEIGFAYWNGTPPYPLDNVEAVKWLRIAAASPTETQAQLDLGFAYRDGRRVERDAYKARYWFGQAALHGDPTAAELARGVR